MGFHAPQEAARILAEAIDYARQGELAVEAPPVETPRTPDGGAGAGRAPGL